MINDFKIWEDFKKGDKNALSVIYFQNVNQLYQYGKKFSNDNELTKDTIQDLFYNLIKARDRLGSTDNVRFYLMKSFRHLLFRNLRSNKRLPIENDIYDFAVNISDSNENEFNTREEVEKKEKLIQEGLKRISPRQREILYYKFTCELNYKEISEIMSLKYDSARKLVFRALQALRETIPENSNK